MMSLPKSIGQALMEAFRNFEIEKPIEQHRALYLWDDIVGDQIARVTTPQKIEKNVLFVSVDSPVWRNELMFLKLKIIKDINKKLTGNSIKDIKFT